MGTKVISIMDDTYELLAKNKRPGESFSEVIRRLIPRKTSIMDCIGLWEHLSDEDISQMKKDIDHFDKSFTKELMKRTSR